MSTETAGKQNEDLLYRRFLSGDTAAYDQLLIRYGDSLVMYLNGYLRDFQESEDLMIEAFARIMAKRPSIRDGFFRAYLYKTARNLALRFNQKKRRLQVFSTDGMDREFADSIIFRETGGDTDDRSVTQRLEKEEKMRALYQCLDRIDPDLREALWLVYAEDMTYAQAASVMGVKVKRVDRLLARGKQQMRNELRKEGVTNAY